MPIISVISNRLNTDKFPNGVMRIDAQEYLDAIVIMVLSHPRKFEDVEAKITVATNVQKYWSYSDIEEAVKVFLSR